jgi:hypothetical protein
MELRGVERRRGFALIGRHDLNGGAATGGKGGGIKTGLQAFLQAFPNPSCLRPSFSKESFGGFVEFQGVTSPPNHNVPLPNFFVGPAFFRPRSKRRRAALRLRAADGGSLRVRAKRGAFMAEERSGL